MIQPTARQPDQPVGKPVKQVRRRLLITRFDVSQQKIRDDKRFDFTVGANYLLLDSWSLRPQFNYTRNDSNIGLYGFSRNEIFVTLRRDWR